MVGEAIVDVENWLHDFGAAGVTRPQVFSCSDGTDRVLKITGLGGTTPAMLVAEWVGSLLAVEMDIPTPRPSLARISDEALATAPSDIRDIGHPGFAFGSEYVRHALQPQGLASIMSAPNHVDVLSRLWVLDAWLGVEDRMFPDFGRNLLINNEGKDRLLMAIDFGLCMTPVLYPMLGAVGQIMGVVEQPRVWPVMHLLDANLVREALSEMDALSEAEIVRVVRTTPGEWADDARKGAVVRYLLDRRPGVRRILATEVWSDT